MTSDRIAEIRARERDATAGPWTAGRFPGAVLRMTGHGISEMIADVIWSNDREFIAHARSDIPWLLDQIAEREREIERLRRMTCHAHLAIDALRSLRELALAPRQEGSTPHDDYARLEREVLRLTGGGE